MKKYTELQCIIEAKDIDSVREMLIAYLGDLNYESFQETDFGLLAYIEKEQFDPKALQKIPLSHNDICSIEYKHTDVADKNWNEEWEKDFSPIVVDDYCYVRAPFHPARPEMQHEIIIMPKMSFGTGHHATTYLMVQEMRNMFFPDKKVLDMGCGTGILAILAEKMGASDITAVDNSEWAYENTKENIQINKSLHIKPRHGGAELLSGQKFDIILANICRNVLLEDMKHYAASLEKGGTLMISGVFTEDFPVIKEEAEKYQLVFRRKNVLKNWVVALFDK